MLKFKDVHIYCDQANTLDFNVIVPGLQKYFTNITIEVRHPFLNNIDNILAESLVSIRISDIKSPSIISTTGIVEAPAKRMVHKANAVSESIHSTIFSHE